MYARPFWVKRLHEAWGAVPIAWLAGVRRSGKTTLAQSLGEEQSLYVNCDLPEMEDAVRNPQLFYVDFVLVRDRERVDALECKWDRAESEPTGLKAFRAQYSQGDNYLVCPLSGPAYPIQAGGMKVQVCDPSGIAVGASASFP